MKPWIKRLGIQNNSLFTTDCSNAKPIRLDSVRFRPLLSSTSLPPTKLLERNHSAPVSKKTSVRSEKQIQNGGYRTVRIHNGNSSMLGFDLKTITIEKDGASRVMHALGKIVVGLPADLAGICEADRLMAVNGVNVDSMSHNEVLEMIRSNAHDLVMQLKTDDAVKSAINDFQVSTAGAKPGTDARKFGCAPMPKNGVNGDTGENRKEKFTVKPHELEVHLRPDNNLKFLGLSLTSELKIHDIDPGSEAATAGIQAGDRVVAINDCPVSPSKPSEAFSLMRRGIADNYVKLRLRRGSRAESHGLKTYPNSIWMAEQKATVVTSYGTNLPCGRICRLQNLTPGASIGLSIKENHDRPHEILAIIPNSPAQLGGLEVGDLINAVNGVNVHRETFEKVKSYIKQGQAAGKLSIEVIDPAVYEEIKDQLDSSQNFKKTVPTVSLPPSMPTVPQRSSPARQTHPRSSATVHANTSATDVLLQRGHTGQYFIKSMGDKSKAMKAGLRRDDIIVTINGISLAELNLSEANQTLSNEIQKEDVELLVRTTGQSDAICQIKGDNVAWRIHGINELNVTPFKATHYRFVSEPDIHGKLLPSKGSSDTASSGKADGGSTIFGRRKKIIQTIKRFCTPNGRKVTHKM